MKESRSNNTVSTAVIGLIIVIVIFAFGTFWTGKTASSDTVSAVESVSRFYLDELAGRREQVVGQNLARRIDDLNVALELMTANDLSDLEHLQSYQATMKRLYKLDKFAFVDEDGLIYTSLGTRTNIDEYQFDYQTISSAEISIFNLNSIV